MCSAHDATVNVDPPLRCCSLPLHAPTQIVEVKAGGTYTRDTWELTWAEKVQAVLDHKSVGNAAVGRKEYASAATQYEQAIGLVESLRLACKTEELDLTAAGVRPALDEHVPLLLNYTLCMLKLKKYSSAVEHATTILRIDPTNVKALFRRGQSHLDRGRDIDLALADLERAHELQPDNGTIHTVLQRCQKVLATAAKQDKKQYAGMFD
jgi:tetratricopeptide (TPR) repeat protein